MLEFPVAEYVLWNAWDAHNYTWQAKIMVIIFEISN